MRIADKPKHLLYSNSTIQSMVHSIPTLFSPFMMVDDNLMFGRCVPKLYLYNKVQGKYKFKIQAKHVRKNAIHPYITRVWSSFDMYTESTRTTH